MEKDNGEEDLYDHEEEKAEEGEKEGSESKPSVEVRPEKATSRLHKFTHFVYAAMQPQIRGIAGAGRGTGQAPPRPPAYYTSAFPGQGVGGTMPLAFLQNPIMDFSYWAPYPSAIPPNIAPGLAHLLSADSILVMQQINLMEMFISMDQTCTFMILNTEGLCMFYAYETSAPITRCCCGDNRPLQIHVKDMYQNEMIYMNKKCSCSRCPCLCQCCCLTAMEVYTMPYKPIGAIIGHTSPGNVLLDIVDVDENVLFQVHQTTGCICIYCCFQAEFSITTITSEMAEVGLIRKQWGGLYREYLSSADVFTVNFPQDLDVTIKALFLGAMFLINYLYYE